MKLKSYRLGKARNMPCVCGSGVKFKRCCYREAQERLLERPAGSPEGERDNLVSEQG